MVISQPGRAQRLSWRTALNVSAWLIFSAALVYAVLYHAQVRVLPFDDAFISYRYVTNVTSGQGLVYNPGERVFGSSTPLYVIWLTLLGLLFRAAETPQLAVRGNAAFYVATVLCVAVICRQLIRRDFIALGLAALFAINPFLLATSSGGMESFMFAALLLGVLAALLAGRLRLAAACAGLAAVTRPEGLLAIGIVGVYWLFKDRRRDAWPAALAFGPLALWVIFATLYYGTPVPHSIIAKNRPLYLLPPGFALHEMLVQVAAWSGLREWGSPLPGGGLLWLLPSVIGSFFLLRPALVRRLAAWLVPITFFALFAFYAWANALMFDWYYPVLLALWFIVVAAGPLSFYRPDLQGHSVRPKAVRYLSPVLAVLGVLVVIGHPLLGSLGLWREGRVGPDIATPDRLRIEAYKQAAEHLNAAGHQEATLAGPEVGALGYYYKGHVFDAAGLVSPQALPFMPVPLRERTSGVAGTISTALVEATRPDFVVTMPNFSSRSIDVNGWFQHNYRLSTTVPLPEELWDSREVLVYSRRGDQTPALMTSADAAWTDHIRLSRLSVPAHYISGQPVTITLFWSPDGSPKQSWKVFVHLLAADGSMRGQDDSVPGEGRAPTDTWKAGEVVVDWHSLEPAAPLSTGEYRLAIGLYDEVSGLRLPLNDGSDVYVVPQRLLVEP